MSTLYVQAQDALVRLMRSDDVTDTQSVEINRFAARINGMRQENEIAAIHTRADTLIARNAAQLHCTLCEQHGRHGSHSPGCPNRNEHPS